MAFNMNRSAMAIEAVEEQVLAALYESGPRRALWRAFMEEPAWAFERAQRAEAILFVVAVFLPSIPFLLLLL